MPNQVTHEVAQAAAALRFSHGHAPALDILALVLHGRRGQVLHAGAPWLAPASQFGQLVAAAFDKGMTPQDWAAWTVPPADPAFQQALACVWRSSVLPAFAAYFGLQLVD